MIGSLPLVDVWAQRAAPSDHRTLRVYTFGDSILDCGRYNAYGVHPGQLLVRNEDALFPEFRGRDLATLRATQLVARARDGATVDNLSGQATGISFSEPAIALLTIGGNDLIAGLAADRGARLPAFVHQLESFLQRLPVRPVLIGTVYDPTFGDDRQNFLAVPPDLARSNLRRVNEVLSRLATRYGALADLHAHFLGGSRAWFSQIIEPSLIGASEVRRVFLRTALPLLQAPNPDHSSRG
jgi:acyl-CoA thioesterase I